MEETWLFWSNPVINPIFHFCINNWTTQYKNRFAWSRTSGNLKEQHMLNTTDGRGNISQRSASLRYFDKSFNMWTKKLLKNKLFLSLGIFWTFLLQCFDPKTVFGNSYRWLSEVIATVSANLHLFDPTRFTTYSYCRT